MVSSNTLSQIERRLSSIRGNTLPFGGLNVILLGDFFQLRPVRGRFVFSSPLWHHFTPYFLDQNVRQLRDPQYAELLTRARIGQLSVEDIDLLKLRLITPPDNNIMHIYPKIKQVLQWNTERQGALCKNSVLIHATHIFSDLDSHAGNLAPDQFIPTDDRDAGELPKLLQISINSRVMLLRNIMTDKGLVNGATGYIEGYVALSRVRTLQGLYFESFSLLKIKANDAVVKEYERLRNLIT